MLFWHRDIYFQYCEIQWEKISLALGLKEPSFATIAAISLIRVCGVEGSVEVIQRSIKNLMSKSKREKINIKLNADGFELNVFDKLKSM